MTKMKSFLVSHISNIATFATIIVIFTHNVLFDREVACTCEKQTNHHCNLYISLPIFIITFLVLWLDRVFIRTCRLYICTKERKWRGRCVFVTILQMSKAAFTGLLWVFSVLMDGDWYACCQNGFTGPQAQIPCKEKSNRTFEEQALIDNLKNESKIIGVSVLLVLMFLALICSCVRGKCCKCCYECCCSKCCCKDCCKKDETGLYELVIIKGENTVQEILNERAKEALTKRVKKKLEDNPNKYCEDFDDAEELMDDLLKQDQSGAVSDEKMLEALEKLWHESTSQRGAVSDEEVVKALQRLCRWWTAEGRKPQSGAVSDEEPGALQQLCLWWTAEGRKSQSEAVSTEMVQEALQWIFQWCTAKSDPPSPSSSDENPGTSAGTSGQAPSKQSDPPSPSSSDENPGTSAGPSGQAPSKQKTPLIENQPKVQNKKKKKTCSVS